MMDRNPPPIVPAYADSCTNADKEGNLIDPESVVDLTGDLEITEDGALTVQTEMEPLGELTISTRGRGEVVTGSVRVVSDGPIGGVLRFDLPDVGVAGVGTSPPVRVAIFPARRQAGGISTAAAIHNPGAKAMGVSCRLMKEGLVLEEVSIPLAANGRRPGSSRRCSPAPIRRTSWGWCVVRPRPGRRCSPEWPWSLMPATRSLRPCRWCRFQRRCLRNNKGSDQVVQGLSRGREGGVIRRDEGGAPRFDAPAGGYFRVLFSGFYPKKGYNPSLSVGVLFLRFST